MNGKIGILALTSVLLLAACGSNTTTTPVAPTVGAVTVPNVAGYTTVIKDANGNVVPSSSYSNLTPGTYTVTYSQAGFQSQSQTFTVSAGQSVVLVAPTLVAIPPTATSGAFYLDAAGKQVAITQDDLNNAGTRFVFYAWLQDQTAGIDPTKVGTATDPGVPAANELQEVAPLNTQNVAAGYVGYKAADGVVRPIVGANVRWDILTETITGGVRFSAADDGGAPSGAVSRQDINDNATSANTYTNSATGNNVRFPSSAEYPLYNVTGVNTPDTNGFTWTALNHDPKATTATARVRAIAYVNGTEITKRFLDKTFAPSAKLTITKTPKDNQAGIGQAKNIDITVTNTGNGPATGIKLNDVLKSGAAGSYTATLVRPADGTPNGDRGFDASFDLAAMGQPGSSRTFTIAAQAGAVGVYCDVATVTKYTNGAFGDVTPNNLNDQACLTVTAPTLNIIKTLGTVDANGAFTPIASGVVVNPNTPVFARITVNNAGNAPATGVTVTDQIDPAQTTAANYAIKSAPVSSPAGTPAPVNANNTGFTTSAFNLAPGASTSFTFSAAGSTDGNYCDFGTFSATSNNGTAIAPTNSQIVCFKVASPKLVINKTNTPTNNLTPGSTYNSTITVTNSGSATATAVAVKDLLGQLQGGAGTFVNNGSGTYTVSGTTQTGSLVVAGNTASTVPATIDLAPGAVLTLNISSTIPAGAPAGQYCDIASYTSTNAPSGSSQACVTVITLLSEQTQLTDTIDPISVSKNTNSIVTSLAINEVSSNESAINNVFQYAYGTTTVNPGATGIFNFSNVEVYYDATPGRDPVTGSVTSDFTNGTARRLVLGTDYTQSAASGTGNLTITLTPSFGITPGGVVFTRTQVNAPANAAPRQYQEQFTWNNTGSTSASPYTNYKTESTTVIP